MRYLYQQLASFAILVLVTVCGLSFTFFRYTESQIYQQVFDDLETVYSEIQGRQVSREMLEEAQNWFEDSFQIKIFWYNADNQRIYPQSLTDKDNGDYAEQGLPQDDIASMKEKGRLGLFDFDLGFTGDSPDAYAIAVPLEDGDSGDYSGYLVIGQAAGGIRQTINKLKANIFQGVAISVVAAVILAIMMARYQTSRINRLRQATRSVTQGHYLQIPSAHRDELDDLADDFNDMTASLAESEVEIERQESMCHQLIMDIAHELRTPLTTMNGLLEGLRYHIFPKDKEERSLELLHKETQRLIRLVNDNLDYEKIRAHEIVLNRVTFSVKSVLEEIVIQAKELTDKKDDRIVLHCPDDLTVYADMDRFRQIIFNLVHNAIQFTESGTITIDADLGEDQWTTIRVRDTGIGMTESELANIWERFYKVDQSRKASAYGESGLGLSIVKQLMKVHQADIRVTSEVDKGTQFTLRFPPESQIKAKNKKQESTTSDSQTSDDASDPTDPS
ncbi:MULTISPECIES: sensor histidine kinase [Aerococcus]|uniref:sensor histidine kinase n=1 Tax=Aerococcus TaxID=1375 RepID=UPI000DCD23E2|nr:HAMP domain-containing sensor histidine kinase [Aerococcus urinae]MDL5183932.1 HAMP domain-containing sensor histidine kinase [Aerococcus mictus]MDK6375215.1 HAMP domain-containing sensor histidine kinase [Aerococcus urinae]MDK6420063.1 HAMP domain-containing sensor histidine kinase [Aerococcus urinae]MDK8075556.1 HAMP domain-containing sensor histidine kinase [Aerococcus urinae]MDK8084675.1 HAMP domain-containing sensor histidine kinase [Aerococcus urinae]